MKYKNEVLAGSEHWVSALTEKVTYATMSTPRLFIWAGTLKGSMSFRIGPWCFGIVIKERVVIILRQVIKVADIVYKGNE